MVRALLESLTCDVLRGLIAGDGRKDQHGEEGEAGDSVRGHELKCVERSGEAGRACDGLTSGVSGERSESTARRG